VHPVFGSLIDRLDWPLAFVITGSATALLAIAWLACATDRPEDSSQPQLRSASDLKEQPLKTLLAHGYEPLRNRGTNSVSEHASVFAESSRRRTLLLLTLSYSAVGYFQYLFFYWLHYYFDSVLHMDKAESRYFAGLPSLAMAACMPIGGWLTDRAVRWRGDVVGPTIVPKFGMIVSALFLMCGIVSTDRVWVVACFTAALGVLGLCEASFWTAAVNLSQQRGGTSAAIMNTGGNGIGLLAPMITPWLGTHLGWKWGLSVGAIVAVLGGLCWFGIKPREDARD
jgi:sugar phosphate permease